MAGMMSGTSLDGMDLILCRFNKDSDRWNYQIIKADTFEYSQEWKQKLIECSNLNAEGFLLLHNEYGEYIGNCIKEFLAKDGLSADLVASHGHTIFHQPDKNFTFQLGAGAVIAATCGITTVSDFRTTDVALGGQGAPLVPVGDELLFNDYQFCLNLGGFANVSNHKDGVRIACDIGPANIVANFLSQQVGLEFDEDGSLGSRGYVMPELVQKLNELPFYAKPAPKSLGREWVESSFLPILTMYELPVEDLLRSVYEHIAIQIGNYLNSFEPGKVLVTGGGAFNNFLMQLIRQKSKSTFIIPEIQLVKFKEALIFAFLGLLRYRHEVNCLSSVTGARRDSVSGIVTPL